MNGTQESQRSGFAQNVSPPTSTHPAKLTQERVLELFDYREDGVLIRKIRTSNRVNLGDVAGSYDKKGYLTVRVDGRTYKVHRLIWLWHYGYFPESGLDHKDRIKDHNYIDNLREAGSVCNVRNTGNRSTNTSGVKGVGPGKRGKRWRARITVFGKTIPLGVHADFIEAVCHRLAAEQALDWAGCDSSSPAFQYVENYIRTQNAP